MKLSLTIFLFVLFKISTAQAALLFSASTSQMCGPYPYKQTSSGYLFLPILAQNTVSQGFLVREEETKLANFLQTWTKFFSNNGDLKLKFHSLCYGLFNDEISTGPNALAYGKSAILIGTKMMKTIRDDIDTFITEKYNYWNPSQKVYITGLKSTAALDFLLLHEFSHLLQNIHDYKFSGSTHRMKELHADCVGASLFTIGKIINNTWTSQDAMAGIMYAYALGDNQVNATEHHGLPVERQNAFSQGMSNIINLRNSRIDISKLTSSQISESCRTYYY